jgi:hypothetical protein
VNILSTAGVVLSGTDLLLVDANSKSSFLQLTGPAKRKINFGSSSVTFTASATSAQVTIPHTFGVAPVAVMCMAKNPNNGLFVFLETAAADATNIYISGRQTQNTAVSASQPFYWVAIA